MRNRAGKPVKKGILFISSFKSQETLEKMLISTRFLCEKKNILINDVAVECNPTGDMEIDRPCVKALVNTISKGILKCWCFVTCMTLPQRKPIGRTS